MIDLSKRITKPVIIFASKHSSKAINQIILSTFHGLINRYDNIFHKKYPEIDKEDLEQIANTIALICIKKWKPMGNSFSFPKYLKQALFFGLRRYCHKELSHLKCMPIKKDEPLMLKEKKIELGLDSRSEARFKECFQEIFIDGNEDGFNNISNYIVEEEYHLKMNTRSIGYKISKFMKKLLSDD